MADDRSDEAAESANFHRIQLSYRGKNGAKIAKINGRLEGVLPKSRASNFYYFQNSASR